ncbi:MAG: undecaprenyl-diphosphate phosphatase [Nitrospirae bacterium]|nr:undecaprenyl-diphosphate phosphatase [Nitrospirota bacterium]
MFEAIILGILQGLTEFIPVSSSAHLILMPWFFGWDGQVNTLAFSVALHFGTLLALVSYFWKDWIDLLKTIRMKGGFVWHIFIATIPAALAGVIFHDKFEEIRSPVLIVFTLSVVAAAMFLVERTKKDKPFEKIGRKDAVIIGIAQALALIPGVSRSGITIVAGLMCGFQREASARFSFLLATPIVAGASIFEARKLVSAGGFDYNIFIAGIIASAIAGHLAIKYLLAFLRNHSLRPFAYYRFILAFVIIVTVWTRAAG